MSLAEKIFRSTLWSALIRWSEHIISLLSLIILSRLLTPSDFGIVATASLVTLFFETFGRLGTEEYLIQKQDLTKEDVDSAWSLQLTFKTLIALCIFLSSFFVEYVFDNQELVDVLKALAVVPILVGLTNIDLILQKKNMNFKPIALISMVSKVLSFGITVSLAYLLESYWAFIAGSAAYQLVFLALSYLVCSYRPSLCFKNITVQWDFTKWTLLKGIVNYINGKADQLMITAMLNAKVLGNYTLSKRISDMPAELCLSPITNALFPGIANLKKEPDAFVDKVNKSLFAICLVAIPLAVVCVINASNIIEILLGDVEKWALANEILPYIFPLMVLSVLSGNIIGFATIQGKVRELFQFELGMAIFSSVIYYLSLQEGNILWFICARYVVAGFYLIFCVKVLARAIGFKLEKLFYSIFMVTLINVVTFMLYDNFNLGTDNAIIDTFISSALYLMLYCAILAVCAIGLKSKLSEFEFVYSQMSGLHLLVNRK